MSKKPPLPPVVHRPAKVKVAKLKLQVGPTVRKPGSMLIDKKRKGSK